MPGVGEVTFEVADLYRWQPVAGYDLVFFSFLLSHVPWPVWPRFWDVVCSSLAKGGTVAFVDDAQGRRGVEEWLGDGVVRRALQDGSEYRIVKVLPAPEEVAESMAQHGLEASVEVLGKAFLVGVGRRAPTDVENPTGSG